MNKAISIGLAALAVLLYIPAVGLTDEADHEHGTGNTRVEACSSALDKADRKTADIVKDGKKRVDFERCECEENPGADDDEKWNCLVRWAVKDTQDEARHIR